MGQVKVETVAVRKKEPVSKPQPKIEARRVVVNNQVKKLHTAVAKASNTSSKTPAKQTVKPKQTAKATSKKASSKKAVKRLSQAKKQSKKK